jgi:hypothetical protein
VPSRFGERYGVGGKLDATGGVLDLGKERRSKGGVCLLEVDEHEAVGWRIADSRDAEHAVALEDRARVSERRCHGLVVVGGQDGVDEALDPFGERCVFRGRAVG